MVLYPLAVRVWNYSSNSPCVLILQQVMCQVALVSNAAHANPNTQQEVCLCLVQPLRVSETEWYILLFGLYLPHLLNFCPMLFSLKHLRSRLNNCSDDFSSEYRIRPKAPLVPRHSFIIMGAGGGGDTQYLSRGGYCVDCRGVKKIIFVSACVCPSVRNEIGTGTTIWDTCEPLLN